MRKFLTLGLVKEKYDNQKLYAKLLSQNSYINSNVTWNSSNEEVATVDQRGTVKAQSEGKTTITVTTEDGGHQDSVEVIVFANDVVTFKDENLEKLIRVKVEKVNGDIKMSDVLTVQSLSLDQSV